MFDFAKAFNENKKVWSCSSSPAMKPLFEAANEIWIAPINNVIFTKDDDMTLAQMIVGVANKRLRVKQVFDVGEPMLECFLEGALVNTTIPLKGMCTMDVELRMLGDKEIASRMYKSISTLMKEREMDDKIIAGTPIAGGTLAVRYTIEGLEEQIPPNILSFGVIVIDENNQVRTDMRLCPVPLELPGIPLDPVYDALLLFGGGMVYVDKIKAGEIENPVPGLL
jgi:hypothetical protein